MCIFLPCCCGLAGGLALLRCILNSAARKMWVCVWGGRAVVVGGNLSYFCLLSANLRGGRGDWAVGRTAAGLKCGFGCIYSVCTF